MAAHRCPERGARGAVKDGVGVEREDDEPGDDDWMYVYNYGFDVERLDGIERCAKLRRLDMHDCRVSDLRPLLGLPALERVAISWHPDIDLESGEWAKAQRRNHTVIERLQKRGVQTDVRW